MEVGEGVLLQVILVGSSHTCIPEFRNSGIQDSEWCLLALGSLEEVLLTTWSLHVALCLLPLGALEEVLLTHVMLQDILYTLDVSCLY